MFGMPRILIFDLETRKDAKELCPSDEEQGWDLLREGKGGVSSLIIWDNIDDRIHLFDDHSLLTAARYLESADLIVSYYGTKFDIPVIEGLIGRKLALKSHYDIYVEIAAASTKRGIIPRKGDLKLDSVGHRCLGRGKNGNGGDVINLVKSGKYADIFEYCLQDVYLTRDVFEFICTHNGVQHMNNSFLGLDIPEWIRKGMI